MSQVLAPHFSAARARNGAWLASMAMLWGGLAVIDVRAQGAPAPVAAPSPVTEPQFTISRFDIEGVSLMPPDSLQKALRPLLGPGKRFSDIELALEAIRAAYEKAGYTAMQVQIPEQTLKDGVIKLVVEELKLQEVEITGARFRNKENIRNAIPTLKEGSTPNDLAISEGLRLANENPGRQMEVTFRSEDDGKLVGVVRAADRDAVAGQVSLDNTGNAATGKHRLGVAMQHHNLFNRDVVGTLQVQTSPGFWQEVRIISGSLRVPIYSLGWVVDASIVDSHVDSGVTALPAAYGTNNSLTNAFAQTIGNGRNYSIRLTNLLARLGSWEQKVGLGYDVKKIQPRITPDASSGNPLDSTIADFLSDRNEYTLRPVGLHYSGISRGDRITVSLQASLSRNVPRESDGASSRAKLISSQAPRAVNPEFRVARMTLSAGWAALGGQASASISGQWTPDVLVAAELFGLGGDGSIRGFSGRVASGDEGERLGLEWQSALRPLGGSPPSKSVSGAGNAPKDSETAPSIMSRVAWGWQIYLEGGQLRRNQPLANDIAKSRLAGAGLGLRLLVADQLSLRTDVGSVLRGEGFALRGDRFAHVSANYGF